VWALTHNRPIPQGWRILHSCDTARCVRPDHLVLGTPADNSLDMALKARTGSSYDKRGRRTAFNPKIRLCIAKLALERGHTIGTLAATLNVPRKAIERHWYNSTYFPDLGLLTAIADVLEVEPGQLFERIPDAA